ncbi:hypothetical protein LCGC14_0792480 [marine sediment metagenome]|uniref:Uncharacterized protein n=1 Tax=marine sediment metagenome TaxID=412755 RepID=A0A0F9QC03_9ZZZZ
MTGFYPTDQVRDSARGNWIAILATMIPEMEPALKRAGKGHVACPMPGHGSKGKNFRVFKDVDQTGGAICSCGSFKEGFNVLMDYHGWDFEETKEAIGRFLQLEKVVPRKERLQARQAAERSAPKKASPEHLDSPIQHGQNIEHAAKDGFEKAVVSEATVVTDESMAEATNAQPEPKEATLADIYQNKPWMRATQEELQEQMKRNEFYQAQLKERIADSWNKALLLNSPAAEPARAYMAHRNLRIRGLNLSDHLRFEPKLQYRDEDGNLVGTFPALLAAIRDQNGELITLHRTYLTKNGKKARVPSPKKMMPVPDDLEVVGGAIRLGEVQDGVVGVAEGMETALSVFRATGLSTWSCVSSSILQGFKPPKGTKVVVNWADKDRSAAGEKAAAVLAERLESQGIALITLLPKVPIPRSAKGIDWNDVLIHQGLFGFPRRDFLMSMIRTAGNGGECRVVG